jgi:RNA polymerase sigma factor (sigma-70 family)
LWAPAGREVSKIHREAAMEGFDLRTTAGQDALAVEIHRLAHEAAQRQLRKKSSEEEDDDGLTEINAEDVAQDVVLWCLERLRAGTFDLNGRIFDSHIRCLVRRRASVRKRQRGRRAARDMERVRDTDGVEKEWVEPGGEMDAAALDTAYAAALEKLTPACRRAYELVRGENLSYAAAGERLGLSPLTVKLQMKQALKAFQRAMGKRRGPRGWIAYEPPAKAPAKRRGARMATAKPG